MADPGAPFWAAQMAEFSFGIFCMIEVASSLDTPGTATGFIQTVEDAPGFDWPDQCRVPASPGIADNCGGGGVICQGYNRSQMGLLAYFSCFTD